MQSRFYFYTDPGHGWLKVPFKLLTELGIENKISSYSYRRNDDVFLEEDCDCLEFTTAMTSKGYDVYITVKISNKSSKIRNYPMYIKPCEMEKR